MEEFKKKNPEEEEFQKAEPSREESKEEGVHSAESGGKQANKSGENSDKADENTEPGKADEPKEPKQESKPPEDVPDPKDEEIMRLKTTIAAMRQGIKPDCVDDAVAIAESYVKLGKAKTQEDALVEVAKKYPDMKGENGDGAKQKGGFKVGASSNNESEGATSDRLSQAFGIKKKDKN